MLGTAEKEVKKTQSLLNKGITLEEEAGISASRQQARGTRVTVSSLPSNDSRLGTVVLLPTVTSAGCTKCTML